MRSNFLITNIDKGELFQQLWQRLSVESHYDVTHAVAENGLFVAEMPETKVHNLLFL